MSTNNTNNNNEDGYTPPPIPPQTPSTPYIGDVTDITSDTPTATTVDNNLPTLPPEHLAGTPIESMNNFAIDDTTNTSSTTSPPPDLPVDGSNNDDEDDDDVDVNAPLEVDYDANNTNNNDTTNKNDNDVEIEEDDDDSDMQSLGLAAKTNEIMNSYKDYIAEIQSEPILSGGGGITGSSGGANDNSKDANGGVDKDLADIEKGRAVTTTNNNNIGFGMGGGSGGLLSSGYGGSSAIMSSKLSGITELEEEFGSIAPGHRPSFQSFGFHRATSVNSTDGSNDTPKMSNRNLHEVSIGEDQSRYGTASFEDFYGELGSYHPTRKYGYVWLYNKKLQKSCVVLISMVILLGIIGGVTTSNNNNTNNNNNGNEKEMDVTWEEVEAGSKLPNKSDFDIDKGNGNNRPLIEDGTTLDTLNGGENDINIGKLLEYTNNKWKPTWFSRGDGEGGGYEGVSYSDAMKFCATGTIHPGGKTNDNNEEEENEKNSSFQGGYILCPYEALCPLGPKSMPFNAPQLLDEWTSSLSSTTNNDVPYDIVNGPAQFTPIIDTPNTWVGIGYNDLSQSCMKHVGNGSSSSSSSSSSLGPINVNNPEIIRMVTQFVLCCQTPELQSLALGAEQKEEEMEEEEAEFFKYETFEKVYLDTVNKYEPITYTRNSDGSGSNSGSGWVGQTYLEAVHHCTSSSSNNSEVQYKICPYEAICPLGIGTQPISGYKESGTLLTNNGKEEEGDDSGAWVPISNLGNDWVRISKSDNDDSSNTAASCVRYTNLNNDQEVPDWGITGVGNEELSRNVICCRVLDDDDDEEGGQDTEDNTIGKEDDTTSITSDTTDDTSQQQVDIEYQSTALKYDPTWFTRSSGWVGKTYLQALAFCASVENMIICPYAALCPAGEYTRPYGGYKSPNDDTIELWTPIMDNLNSWVQVGDRSDACVTHTNMYGKDPDWGLTGDYTGISGGGGDDDENMDVVPYVMCCELNENDIVTQAMPEHWDPNNNAEEESSSSAANDSVDEGGGDEDEEAEVVIDHQSSPAYTYTRQSYNPIAFNRTTGYTGLSYDAAFGFCESTKRNDDDDESLMLCPFEAYCPMGPQNIPYNGFVPTSTMWAPISNSYNMWVEVGTTNPCMFYNQVYGEDPTWEDDDVEMITGHVMCCSAEKVLEVVGNVMEEYANEEFDTNNNDGITDENAIQEMLSNSNPTWYHRAGGWNGKTWPDAIEYCAREKGKQICPYEAICPNGPIPVGGVVFEEPNGSWAPIANGFNEWVSVSSDKTCVQWDKLNPDPPDWGVGGREELTRHIVCCNDEDGESYEDSESNADVQDEITYEPTWFGRENGWVGATYAESIEFCATKEEMVVCPFDAICPDGSDSLPLGGPFDEDDSDMSWAPVSNDFNEWVKIDSTNGSCLLWSSMNPELPEWGISGAREDATGHVMCCKPVDGQALDATTFAPTYEDDNSPQALVADHYKPRWYDRDDGWTGTTWPEAIEFCSTFDSGLNDSDEMGMMVCPYEAYCPYGSSNPPLGGVVTEPAGAWSPISNGFNEWVKVDDENMCVRWSSLNLDPPSWGVDDGAEEMTRHVMCCIPTQEQVLDVTPTTEEVATPVVTTTAATTTTTTMTTTTTTSITTPEPTSQPSPKPTLQTITNKPTVPAESILISQTFEQVENRFSATWYDRSSGWKGQSYFEGLSFCALKGSYIPCPYEAYCPLGPGKHVLGGVQSSTASYAPIIDVPNGWVSIGPSETCMPYNSYNPSPPKWGLTGEGNEEITRRIMCCREPEDGLGVQLEDESYVAVDVDTISTQRSEAEQSAMDTYHPVWYDRRDGYHGTTIEAAETFCNNVGGKRLCPLQAYCPNGVPTPEMSPQAYDEILYLDRSSFQGEKWAPFSGGPGNSPDWVLIGKLQGLSSTTCASYTSLEDSSPMWDGSDAPAEHKQHVLCCEDEEVDDQGIDIESAMRQIYQPIWFDRLDGWNGGSWDDAVQFCNGHGGRELCTYKAICPYGFGKSPMGGHRYDFDAQGEQWAPIRDEEGETIQWVMIGQKYQNSATTCLPFDVLEGSRAPPNWEGMADLKKHVMCCNPVSG